MVEGWARREPGNARSLTRSDSNCTAPGLDRTRGPVGSVAYWARTSIVRARVPRQGDRLTFAPPLRPRPLRSWSPARTRRLAFAHRSGGPATSVHRHWALYGPTTILPSATEAPRRYAKVRRLLASLSAAALLLYDRVGDGRDRAVEWSSLQLPGRPGDLPNWINVRGKMQSESPMNGRDLSGKGSKWTDAVGFTV